MREDLVGWAARTPARNPAGFVEHLGTVLRGGYGLFESPDVSSHFPRWRVVVVFVN